MNRKRLTKKIKKKWSEFTRIYGHELGFASVTIRYTDDGNSFDTYISMTVDSNDTTVHAKANGHASSISIKLI